MKLNVPTRLRRWLRRGLAGSGSLLLLVVLAAVIWPRAFLCVRDTPPDCDAMVILGGEVADRVRQALTLYREAKTPLVFVIGCGDAPIARRLLIAGGVPQNAIVVEDRSTNTWENAQRAVPLLRQHGVHRVLLVTTWYHSRRARACFRHVAPDMEFYSVPAEWSNPDHLAGKRWKLVYSEYIKLAGYWIGHGVFPF